MPRPTLTSRAPGAAASAFAPSPSRTSHSASLCTRPATVMHTQRSRLHPHSQPFSTTATSHARLIKRPHRPYTFTQLLTLSDGSTVLHRTTSPAPVYRSSRDVRNSPLWNPSNAKMVNVEEDDSGRLRAFRRRFGRSFDASAAAAAAAAAAGADAVAEEATSSAVEARDEQMQNELKTEQTGNSQEDKSRAAPTPSAGVVEEEDGDNLMDLISSYAKDQPSLEPVQKAPSKPKKGKK